MKKIYLAPYTKTVPIQMSKMICESADVMSNVEFYEGGEAPIDFGSDDVRSREFNSPMDNWSEWDDSEEEQY